MKIPAPNYTQTPNDLFDHWLPLLGEGELKVLLVIMRKTFGWHKTNDAISISQLARFTGMHEETVVKAAKSLQSKGVVTRHVIGPAGLQKTIYQLVITQYSNNSYPSEEPSGPLGLDGPVKTEAQKKPFPKETPQKKQQQKPAVVSSKEEEKKPEVYPCLNDIEVPINVKKQLTKKYALERVLHALKWLAQNDKPLTKGLAATLTWACNVQPEMEKKKRNPVEIVREHFKHGEKYNGAECFLTEEYIAFQRGIKIAQVNFGKYFKWENLAALCDGFGIKCCIYG